MAFTADPESTGRSPVLWLLAGFVLLLGVAAGAIALTIAQRAAGDRVLRTRDIGRGLDALQTLLTDAETSQRGYILTGKLDYLDPYNVARRDLPAAEAHLRELLLADTADVAQFDALIAVIADKFSEMRRIIDLRAANDLSGAIAAINEGRGKTLMDQARTMLAAWRTE